MKTRMLSALLLAIFCAGCASERYATKTEFSVAYTAPVESLVIVAEKPCIKSVATLTLTTK